MVSNRIRTGDRLLKLGRFNEALACFAAGLKETADSKARFGCAVALQLLGRWEDAERQYNELLAADPAHEEALSNLVAMSVERFDLGRVERYARRLLELKGDSMVALQALVIAAVERREYETAAQYFSRIVPDTVFGGDAIEYRLSPEMVERLRSLHGTLAHPY